MSRAQVPFFALNAGEVGKAALARVDLEKMRLAAESMINFMPTVLGPISMRPGLKFISSTYNNLRGRLLPFIFNASTTSLIEITSAGMRVRTADSLVAYPNHATVLTNGSFDGTSVTYTRTTTLVTVTSAGHGLTTGTVIYCDFTSGGALDGFYSITSTGADTFTVTTVATGTIATSNITYYRGWSNESTSGASTSFASGQLVLTSTEYSYARARQSATVAGGDQAKVHCVKVDVARGPVIFRVGSTAGGAEIIGNQTLDEGVHFIAFTPGVGTIYLEVEAINEGRANRLVNSIDFYKNANLLIPVPWAEADLNQIRYGQSGSVIFLACDGYQQYKIERRGANSWSLAKYYTTAGPYLSYSARKEKLKASATTGDVTITADQPYFSSGMVGSTFEISHPKQRPDIIFTGEDQYSDWIRVTGVNADDRAFKLTITYNGATTPGTITLERAYGVPEGWTSYKTYTADQAGITIDDSISSTGSPQIASSNNLIVYYRLASRPGSGVGAVTVSANLNYEGGNKTGIFRVTGFTNSQSVSAEVVRQLGDTNYTDDWRRGAWSNAASWPSSVAFHDGRLWWAGLDKVYGSVSDDYYNFDPATEGDSGPIVRSVATGPVEGIGWMLPLQRLVVGTASAEVSIRSSSFDEPLTPTAFTARNASTVGSAAVQAIAVDSAGIFVQRNGSKIFELVYDVEINDYGARELTRLNQQICQPGVSQIAVQRQPDTRVYFIKEDGSVAMLLYDRADAVVGWCRIETDGEVESVVILPTGDDDAVYFVVKRTIEGVAKRYIEKFASSEELSDVYAGYLLDSCVRFTSASPVSTISGLSHLAGREVVVGYPRYRAFDEAFEPPSFQSGSETIVDPRGTYTVSAGGEITLPTTVTEAVVGLPYTARFKSVKLAYGSAAGTALTQKKRVDHLALLGINTALDGIRIGRDFVNMTKLSSVYKGKVLDPYYIVPEWDYEASSFSGKFDTDSRVCIEVTSPYPATILGMVIHMQNNDRG